MCSCINIPNSEKHKTHNYINLCVFNALNQKPASSITLSFVYFANRGILIVYLFVLVGFLQFRLCHIARTNRMPHFQIATQIYLLM